MERYPFCSNRTCAVVQTNRVSLPHQKVIVFQSQNHNRPKQPGDPNITIVSPHPPPIENNSTMQSEAPLELQ
jgi:hypothetical protein